MYPPMEQGAGSIQSIDQEAHFYGTDESNIILFNYRLLVRFKVYLIPNQLAKIRSQTLIKQKMDKL